MVAVAASLIECCPHLSVVFTQVFATEHVVFSGAAVGGLPVA